MGGGELFPRREKLKLIQLVLFICFFLLLLLFRLLQDTKEKKERERDTVKIEENVRDNYYISGDII